jgi:hypothetical protein
MCEVRSRKNGQEQKKKQKKKKYSGQQQKEIDCDEPHPAPNEKTQPIQWTERPTGALVAVNSLCGLLGLVGINCIGYFVFLAEDFTRIAPPHVGPSSCKAHSTRIYRPGLSNIGKIYPLSSLPALFQGFWILTLISTLGSWGYPPDVDFWDLLAKISPLSLPALFQGFLVSHPHIYLGSWDYPPDVDFWDLWAKFAPPCLCVPHFKAFGFSPSYLPGLPVVDFWDLLEKMCVFLFSLLRVLPQ